MTMHLNQRSGGERFVQKQVPDKRPISNETTLTLTLPSDGRGNSQPSFLQLPKRLDAPTD